MKYYTRVEPAVIFVLKLWVLLTFFASSKNFWTERLWRRIEKSECSRLFPWWWALFGLWIPPTPCCAAKRLALANKTKGTHHDWRRVLGRISTNFHLDGPGFLVIPTSCMTLDISGMHSEMFIRFNWYNVRKYTRYLAQCLGIEDT